MSSRPCSSWPTRSCRTSNRTDPIATTERQYCSDLSRAAGEPLAGTAATVDVWLLLEYRPVWRGKAVTDNDLPPAVTDWLDRQMESMTGSRPETPAAVHSAA